MEKSRHRAGINEFIKDQQGMVLVFSLLVLIMVSMWGAATLTLSTNDYHVTRSSVKSTQAYYLAEGGLEQVIAKIKKDVENGNIDSVNDIDDSPITIDGIGTVNFTIDGQLEDLEIEAVGEVDGFKKTLLANLEIIIDSELNYDVDDVNVEVDDINIDSPTHSGEVIINKDEVFNELAVNGKVSVEKNNNVTVNSGTMKATGEIFVDQGCTINSSIESQTKIIIEKNSEIKGYLVSQGEIQLKQGSNVSSYVIGEDNVIIEKNSTIDGYIMGGKEIQLKENSTVHGDVIAEGNVIIEKNSIINGNILTNGEVQLKHGSNVTGNILAKNKIIIEKNGTINGIIKSEREIQIKQGNTINGCVISQENIIVEKNSNLTGNILSLKDIEIKENNDINGNIDCVGKLIIEKNTNVYGDISYGSSDIKENVFISGIRKPANYCGDSGSGGASGTVDITGWYSELYK